MTQLPTATIAGGGSICNDGSSTVDVEISFTGTGPWTFVYNSGAGNIPITTGDNPHTISTSSAGEYILLAVDDANCPGTANGSVMVNATAIPTANAGPDQNYTCGITDLTLSGSGSSTGANITYEWSTGDGSILSGVNDLNAIVGGSGLYTITVCDGPDCCMIDQVNVFEDANQPDVNAGPDLQLDCGATQLTLQGSSTTGGNLSYAWTASPGNIVSGDNSLTPVVDQEGTYTLTITNLDNNCQSTDQVVVSSDANLPNVDAGADQTIDCTNTTAMLQGTTSTTGNLMYEWTTSDGNIISGMNSLNPIVDSNGTYTLTITNLDNNCTASDNVLVSVTNLPDPGISTALSLCNTDSSIDLFNSLDGTPEAGGTWLDPFGIATAVTFVPGVNQAGIYSYVFDLGPDCPLVSSTVTVDVELPVQVVVGTPVCDATNTSYTISLQVAQGDLNNITWVGTSGTYNPGTGTITSDPIPSGDPYFFQISGGVNCSSIDINGMPVTCACLTNSGAISPGSIDICFDPNDLPGAVGFTYDNSLESLDGDDAVYFLLHSDPNDPLGSYSAIFDNLNDIQTSAAYPIGVPQYVTAIATSALSDGSPDLTDGCLSLAQTVSFTLQEVPEAVLAVGTDQCAEPGNLGEIVITFTGDGPWDFSYTNDGDLIELTNINSNPLIIDTISEGFILPMSLSNTLCDGTVSGSALVELLPLPILNNTELSTCSQDGISGIFDLSGFGTANYPDGTVDWS